MKKLVILFCLFALLLPFAACGKEEGPKEIVLFPYAGRSIEAKAGTTFTVADTAIATVDDSGLLVARKPGSTELTVQSGKKTTVYPVTVLDPAAYIDLYDYSQIQIQNSDILKQMEESKRKLLKRQFQHRLQRETMEQKILEFSEMETEFEEMKAKFKYEEGKFLTNDRKDNEILIVDH